MMRNRYFLAFILTITSFGAMAQRDFFKTPYQISEGTKDVGSTVVTYRTARHAMAGVADSSINYVNLNGEWSVRFFDDAAKVRASDLDRGNDLKKDWKLTKLPLAWQMNGSGAAIFADEAYDFLSKPPVLGAPLKMPVGGKTALYARDFTVPFDFMDRMLYLTIGASRGRTTLYINGQRVGFATDSKSPAQYDITPYVSRGQNRVVLQIEQYSGASWVENQQMWRLSGANRDIFILAQPKIRMRDFMVRTSLDPTYQNGLLETALLLKTELLNPHTVTVYYDFYGPDGALVAQNSREVNLGLRAEDTVRFTTSIMGVKKWNAETPNLYTILYRVKREGRFTEYGAVKAGFLSVETKDKQLLVNGVAPVIKGVNFEEFDPRTGNVLSKDKVRQELLRMRLMGVNAIRTGGYPLPSFFYELTDSIGFYVVDVANIDASGLENSTRKGRSVANDPAWKDVFVQRAVAVYERSENNPSVIAVALGENAGNGYCMYQSYMAIKARNGDRVVIYDGAGAEWNTDVVCPLYPTVADLAKLKVQQPIIASRVSFDKAYWNTKGVQGAFMDRWCDPSITASAPVYYEELTNDYRLKKRDDGAQKLGSVEDHEKQISDLFSAVEITTKDAAKGIYTIENRMQYSDLNQFKITCSTMSGGKIVKTTPILINCPAGATAEITIPGASVISSTKELLFEVGDIYKVLFTR